MKNLRQIVDDCYEDAFVCESRATRYMSQLFDDTSLTFGQLRDIFTKLFSGQLSVSEKTAGQDILVTIVDGTVKIALNKQMIASPLSLEQVHSKLNASNELKVAIESSMQDLADAFSTLAAKSKISLFSNGKKYASFRLIYPPLKHLIDYGGKCLLQLNGMNVYDENWKEISDDKENVEMLYKLLAANNALKQSTFEIAKPVALLLKSTKTGKENLSYILAKLSKLIDGLGWNTTINDYAKERFERYIVNKAIAADFPVSKKSEFVSELADRLSSMSTHHVSKNDLKTFAKRDGLDVNSQQYRDFVTQLDATLDDANNIAIKPLEDLVISAGLLLMKNLAGYVSADPQKTAQKLSAELGNAIAMLSAEDVVLDKPKLKSFKSCLAKLDEYQREAMGTEGILFTYKGKVYKMTSTFGPINQICEISKN